MEENRGPAAATGPRFFSLAAESATRVFCRPFSCHATRASSAGFPRPRLFSTEVQPIARTVVKTRSSSRRVESARPPLLPRRGRPVRGGLCKAVSLVARRRCLLREMHSRVHLHPLSVGSGIAVTLSSRALCGTESRELLASRDRDAPYRPVSLV